MPCQVGEALQPHFGAMIELFGRGLSDDEASVRVSALRAVTKLVTWVIDKEMGEAARLALRPDNLL